MKQRPNHLTKVQRVKNYFLFRKVLKLEEVMKVHINKLININLN
jgi:hypothetical protein